MIEIQQIKSELTQQQKTKGFQKVYRYVRYCTRCGEKYITSAKTSKVCRKCNLKVIKNIIPYYADIEEKENER